jgi:hypothetical protein
MTSLLVVMPHASPLSSIAMSTNVPDGGVSGVLPLLPQHSMCPSGAIAHAWRSPTPIAVNVPLGGFVLQLGPLPASGHATGSVV